jgi:hypothetical protein
MIKFNIKHLDRSYSPLVHKLHSDLNSLLKMLRKVTEMLLQSIARPLSCLVFHNRAAP